MSLVTKLFLPLLFLAVTVSASCPAAEDISPCECIDDDDYIEVKCNGQQFEDNSEHSQVLKRVFEHLDKSDTILLLLEELKLDSLSFTHLSDFKISKIEIEYCNLENLNDDSLLFAGLEDSLEEIHIASSITEDVNIKLNFRHLKRLAALEFFDNEIKEVSNDLLKDGPETLNLVTFSNNGIERVGDRVFENLKNLEYLTLEGNRFGPIRRSMLPNPASLLNELVLDNNALTSIPQDFFTNMPELKTLSLKSNGITRIEERTFKPIWQKMEAVDFGDNPIECDSTIDWIIQAKTSANIQGKCSSPHERRDVEIKDLIGQ